MREDKITLRDGRLLGFAELGEPNGFPVLSFHGTPGCRLSALPVEGLVQQLGVRLITVDRPGYGFSTFQEKRSILDWPQDIVELAGNLNIKRFGVVGFSGGGAYAAACAFSLPTRVTGTALVSALGPATNPLMARNMELRNRVSLKASVILPWQVRRILTAFVYGHRRWFPAGVVHDLRARVSTPDKEALSRPEVISALKRSHAEAFRNGTKGYAWDASLLAREWGFNLAEIRIPVFVWQGLDDRLTPPDNGKYLANTIPYCRIVFLPNKGHMLLLDHWGGILQSLSSSFPTGGSKNMFCLL